jgi:hypothetical protein
MQGSPVACSSQPHRTDRLHSHTQGISHAELILECLQIKVLQCMHYAYALHAVQFTCGVQ